jgi:transposase
LAKESVRAVYLTDDVEQATILLDNAIEACAADEVPEIRTLAHTLGHWRTELLNHHRTGASNGPTDEMNFCAKQVKRAGRGFANFSHYRLRVLLHAGGVKWSRTFQPPRITSTRPQ